MPRDHDALLWQIDDRMDVEVWVSSSLQKCPTPFFLGNKYVGWYRTILQFPRKGQTVGSFYGEGVAVAAPAGTAGGGMKIGKYVCAV